jgi:MFS family permease
MQSLFYRSIGLSKINPAWSNVLSGFSVQIVLGSLYLWGNITPITTSYLRIYDSSLTYNDTLFVYIVALAFNGIFVMFSGYFQSTFGPRLCVIVGGYLICFAAFCSSYCTSLVGFILTQGAMFGAGFGITYSASFTTAIQWLPERKALLTGLVISGVGFGTSGFR